MLPPLEVPPRVKSVLAGPRSAAFAAWTRSVTPILRTRSRSASHRFGLLGFGHHGPSVNCAAVSLTRPVPAPPSVARRGAGVGATPSHVKMQFSPMAYGAIAVVTDGLGP